MKIELISVGSNQISVMDLLRELGGMTLYESQKLTENLPSEFVCELPDEQMPEILKKFEQTGSKVEFTAGVGNPKAHTSSNYIKNILFRTDNEEKSDSKKLTDFSQIKEYLHQRANFKKAIIAGCIGTVFLTGIISFVYGADGERQWWYDILTALAIGFSIRHAGKGTDGRFGIAAAVFTLLTLILLQISFTIILMHTNELSILETVNYVKPNVMQIIRALLCAWLAFSVSFTLVVKDSEEEEEIRDLKSSKKLSDYILFRKNEMKKNALDKKDKLMNNALKINEYADKKKSKKEKQSESQNEIILDTPTA